MYINVVASRDVEMVTKLPSLVKLIVHEKAASENSYTNAV